MFQHQEESHATTKMDMGDDWDVKITTRCKSNLERQVIEGVSIHQELLKSWVRGSKTKVLNSKLDHHQAGLIYQQAHIAFDPR